MILLSLQVPINAQNYAPLAVDGAHWIIRYDVMETPWHFDALWEYHAQGDTIIEDQNYLKVYRRELEINDDYMPPFTPATAYELVGLLREDIEAKKVYAIMLSEDMPYTYNACSLVKKACFMISQVRWVIRLRFVFCPILAGLLRLPTSPKQTITVWTQGFLRQQFQNISKESVRPMVCSK